MTVKGYVLDTKQQDIKRIKVVMYTDGSAGGHTKVLYLGMGYHGYYFDLDNLGTRNGDVPKEGFPSADGYIGPDNIMDYNTDVSQLKITPLGYFDGYYGDNISNGFSNDAEVKAIKYGLISVFKKFKNLDKHKLVEINVYTDSMVALLIFKRAYNHFINNKEWLQLDNKKLEEKISNEYKSNKPSTQAHIKESMLLLQEYMGDFKDLTIKFLKVKGHSGNIGNEQADTLATTARRHGSFGNPVDQTDWTTNRYWKPTINRHPFLRYKELFFMHNTSNYMDSSKGYFTIMNYGPIEIGKKSSYPIYGIVRLNDVPSIIKDLTQLYQMKYSSKPLLIYALDLNKLYLPNYQRFLENYNTNAFTTNKNKQLLFMNKDPMVYPIYPPGLAKKVYDSTSQLINILEQARFDIKEGYENKPFKIYIDITDKIFKRDEKKKRLTLILPNSNKEIKLKGIKLGDDTVDITLVHDVDIINRNHLKALEKNYDTKIYLLFLTIGTRCYTYYTLIMSDSLNSYGCWHNLYSSKVFLPNKKKETK